MHVARRALRVAVALAVVASTLMVGHGSAHGQADTVVVSSDADSGPGSFREAVAQASSNRLIRSIEFEPELDIVLESPVVYTGSQNLLVDGNDAGVTSDAAPTQSRDSGLFVSRSAGSITLREMVLDSSPSNGIAVLVPEDARGTVSVSLRDVSISNSQFHGLYVDDRSTAVLEADAEARDSCIDPHPVDSAANIKIVLRRTAIFANGSADPGFDEPVASGCPSDFDGVRVEEGGAGRIEVDLVDALAFENHSDGIRLVERGRGDVRVAVERSGFFLNGEDGLRVDEADGGSVDLSVANTMFNVNSGRGLAVGEADTGKVAMDVLEITANDNAGAGVNAEQILPGRGTLRIVDSELTGNGGDENTPTETEGVDEQLIRVKTVADAFTLQLLHASDLEGGVDALDRAANFAAIIDQLEDSPDVDASLTISAGDNYIPGRGGRADITIMNTIGFDASALGDHEFDAGTGALAEIIAEDLQDPGLADDRWVGAQFPYLSVNLDFSGDDELSDLFTPDILSTTAFESGPEPSLDGSNPPKLAPASFVEVGGERIGVIGATTQLLAQISSPGDTEVITGGADDMAALAALIQPQIDAMTDMGIDKIVIASHLQQLELEEELAGLLSGVDIIIAGGSNSLLANEDDELREGDTADAQYPLLTTDDEGDPVAIVSTDGQYSYVGQLVVDFDGDGNLIGNDGSVLTSIDQLDLTVNGPIKAEEEAVENLWGSAAAAFADGTKGELVQHIVDAVQSVVGAG